MIDSYVVSLLFGVVLGWLASYLTSRFQIWMNTREKKRQPEMDVMKFTFSRYAILLIFLLVVIMLFYFSIQMGVFMYFDSLDPETGQHSGGAVSYIELLLVALVPAIFSYIVSEISRYAIYRRELSSNNTK